jgi:GNAT superfamily N-acetyltransferase
MPEIEVLSLARALESLDALVALLREAVESGAAVGFLPPLTEKEARLYWHRVMERLPTGETLLLGAREGALLVGCAQLEMEQQPNGRHRAAARMLLVNQPFRRRGIGRALMRALEKEARNRGRTMLTTETRKGEPYEALCRQLHYQRLGSIPRFARGPGASLEDYVFYFRELEP